MLFHFLYSFRHEVSGLNVLRYITFRTAVASLTALFLVLVLGPWMIERLRRLQIGQYIRDEGPKAHQAKAGTPTMGGVLIVAGILVPTLLWGDLTNRNVWILILATLAFGAIGFVDDFQKVARKRSLGLTARRKLWAQVVVALLIGTALYLLSLIDPTQYSTRVVFPFVKTLTPDLSAFYILFALAVRVRRAHEDGQRVFSNYLDLLFQPGAGEVTIFCGAMVGASMGFLWWNCYPAQVFMGDTGSLALGGALGTVAILIKQELLLFSV